MLKNSKKILMLLLIIPCLFIFSSCKKNNPPENSVQTYSITYVLNGGENNKSNPTSYTNTSETFSLLTPQKSHYDFLGWYSDENYSNQVFQIEKGSSGDKTLYAKWSPKSYDLIYILNGGTNNPGNPSNYTFESEDIVLLEPKYKDYEFDGWYLDSSFISKVSVITKGSSGKKTLYAKWKDITYTINYKLNGGLNNEANPLTFTLESPTITLLEPTKFGYNFKGWFTDEEYKNQITKIEKGTTTSLTLYAKWECINYDIIYVLNGGTNNAENPNTYTIESSVNLSNPTRYGYNFDGWYADAEFSSSKSDIAIGSSGVQTFYAKWIAKTHTITFNYDGADRNNEIESIIVTFNEPIGTLPNPEKDDYTFAGWWRNNSLYDENTLFNIDDDIELTAFWRLTAETLTYTVIFDTLGGSVIAPIKDIPFASKIQKPTNPIKTGYKFVGWYLNNDEWDFNSSAVTDNITLTAKWELVVYSITYHLDEGLNSKLNPSEYTIESETITRSNPNKDNFDFLGWYLDEKFTLPITEIVKGSYGNLEIYACWREKEITKSTADITINYNLPEQLNTLYSNTTLTLSVGTRQDLQNFNNLNLRYYFKGYYYFSIDNQRIDLEENVYYVETSRDLTIFADWDTENLLKYYFTDGLMFNIDEENNTASIISYSGSSSTIYIPEYYKYNDKDYLISSIGDGSFDNDYIVTNINFLPRNSTIEIGILAFRNSAIENFDFTYVSKIGESAFSDSNIKEFISSQNLISIDSYAFINCKGLENVNLSDSSSSFTLIPNYAFSGCVKLTSITLPNRVMQIRNYCFDGCTSLTSIDFLSSLSEGSSLNSYVFNNCTGLESVIMPNVITSVGYYIFLGCENLKSIELNNLFDTNSNFRTIFGLDNIETITIGGSKVTSISSNYFNSLPSLTTFRMGNYIEIVNENAFKDCPLLSNIQFSDNLIIDEFNINAFVGTYWYEQLNDILVIGTTIVYIPASEDLTEIRIDSGITSISKQAAYGNTFIISVHIPNSVTFIGEQAFSDCTNLETVIFENGSQLNTISSRAFYNCRYLSQINLENCSVLNKIGEQAFGRAGYYLVDSYLNGEEGLILPNSLKIIEKGAFLYANISKFVIDGDVFTSDENGIIYEQDENNNIFAIVSVPVNFASNFYIVPSNITKVYENAFYSCLSLNYVYINHTVTLGNNAFKSSSVILTGQDASITFESGSSKYYLLTELEDNYECTSNGNSYSVTVTEDVPEGYYYIRYEDKIILISVVISGGVKLVNRIFDMTNYFDLI